MYLIQCLDDLDPEALTEELIEHMITALEMLYEFHKSNSDMPPEPRLRD
jgi:hypothetical protein